MAGRPVRQPVVARGPFVMNTESQIVEAFTDYRAGVFGSMPTTRIQSIGKINAKSSYYPWKY
jgi:hypothetical protein